MDFVNKPFGKYQVKIVNMLGGITIQSSKGLRMIQSGNIGFYIFAMVFGLVVMVGYIFFLR